MGQMFRSFVAVFVGCFSVLAKIMLAMENLSDVAVATSGQFKDDAEQDRALAKAEAVIAREKRKAAIERAKAAQANNPYPVTHQTCVWWV